MPRAEWNATYYARVMVDDAPGVLRDISGCMAAHGVSVAQMIQKTETGQHAVPPGLHDPRNKPIWPWKMP